ncbi:MAG: hypothetical protein ACPF9D_06570, partial [Owenweeksia sp.]
MGKNLVVCILMSLPSLMAGQLSDADRVQWFDPGIAIGIGDLANKVLFQPDQSSSTTFEKRPIFMAELTNRTQLT